MGSAQHADATPLGVPSL